MCGWCYSRRVGIEQHAARIHASNSTRRRSRSSPTADIAHNGGVRDAAAGHCEVAKAPLEATLTQIIGDIVDTIGETRSRAGAV